MVPPSGSQPPGTEPPGKDPAAFRTIREVSEQLGVPQHVLRFWETRFPELKPLQRGGNRRYYRPGDVAFAAALHKLLHQDGYTVKGVRKLISDHGAANLVAIAGGESVAPRAARSIPPEQAPSPAVPAPEAVAVVPAPVAPVSVAAFPPAYNENLVAELQLLRDRLASALAA
jgi:DNA-binding transcriptional MerR regulator